MNTHFVTPNGLDGIDKKGRHETTAQDLAKIMARCIKNQQFLEITQQNNIHLQMAAEREDLSAIITMPCYPACKELISGKTGYTSKAGYCYVGAVKQKNMTMTFSVLASGWPPHKTYKWKDVRKLVQYATDHYERREIIADTSKIKEISIKNGLKEKVLLKTGNLKAAFLVKKTDKIKIESILPSFIDAPVKERAEESGKSISYQWKKSKERSNLRKAKRKTKRLLVLF